MLWYLLLKYETLFLEILIILIVDNKKVFDFIEKKVVCVSYLKTQIKKNVLNRKYKNKIVLGGPRYQNK